MNSEISKISDYLQRTVSNLIPPLETIKQTTMTPVEGEIDGLGILRLGFTVLAFQLFVACGDYPTDGLQALADVNSIFNDDEGTLEAVQVFLQDLLENRPEWASEIGIPLPVLFLDMYDVMHGTEFSVQARAMYFRFANAIIKADGVITPQEEAVLEAFRKLLYEPTEVNSFVKEHSSTIEENPRNLDELLTELNSLIGLDVVKRDVMELVNFIKIQQLRTEKGMNSVPISRHLVFLGNPGTGKTTIARLLAQVYKSLNIVSKGSLVETDRSGLVAGYVGQTALKVKEIVNQALGGVLFIDEAYSLAGGDKDYGAEAVDTLIKLMEDNRDDLIVVVAGYTDKMNQFLVTNPGLKSRFNKYFYFEDYKPVQLVEIFELFCNNAGFKLSIDARKKVATIFQLLHDVRDETFGNARLARNVFERSVNNQANRIIAIPDITENILSTIEAVDIPGELELNVTGVQGLVNTKPLADKAGLRSKLIETVKKDPKNVKAWLDLSELVEKPEQAIDCLQRVLKLEPSNQVARDKLNVLASEIN
jgi:AAA+ superfamily predicted ATPase